MFMLTLIARANGSLSGLDARLAELEPRVPASFTYADEIQVGFESAESAVRAAMIAASGSRAWVGIGVGPVSQVDGGRPEGAAVEFSRVAVERAGTGSPVRGIVVVGARHWHETAEQASGVLRLMYRTVAERSEIEQKVVALVVPGVRGQLKSIAQLLKISPQAVSKTLTRAKWHEEQACYPAVVALLEAME